MFNKYRLFYLITILTLLMIFGLTENNNDDSIKIKKEIEEEVDYIYEDATLTTKIHLNQLYSQLELMLNDSNVDINKIIKDYSEVISIDLIKNSSSDKKLLNISPFFTEETYKYVYLNIPANNQNKDIIYQVKVKLDILNEIKDKQQLRMYTVTHLQNNRWKTTPTKYIANKNLSLSIDERLPSLDPSKEEKGISHYIENEIVIKFRKDVDEQYINNFLIRYDLEISKRRDNVVIIKSLKSDTKNLMKTLQDNRNKDKPYIEYIEPHFIYLTNDMINNFIPNDALYSEYQWNLPSIYTEKGWETTRGKDDIIIAVVDTGVDLNHPEFKNKLVDGYNVLKPNSPPMDDDGHGTHVAGIISANTNNEEGIAGITWYNKIMPIKVLDQSGAGTLFDVAEGIYWATEHGAKIINLSLGNYAESRYLYDAIKYAYSKDVILVAASGNDNINDLGYPAAYPEVIAVAAVDHFKQKAEFSNYGPYIDVAAPGVNIASTYPNFEYAAMSGTSMSSPHVAGLAGLIRAINPTLSNEDVINIIKESATDIGVPGKDKYFGYGEINVEKAINLSTTKVKVTEKNLFDWIIKFFKW